MRGSAASELLFPQGARDEGIDRRTRPPGILDAELRNRWALEWTQRPPVLVGTHPLSQLESLGPRRAAADPLSEHLDLGVREWGAFLRHVRIRPFDGEDQLALDRIGLVDDRAAASALEEDLSRMKVELPLTGDRVVTPDALPLEDRRDLLTKVRLVDVGGGVEELPSFKNRMYGTLFVMLTLPCSSL